MSQKFLCAASALVLAGCVSQPQMLTSAERSEFSTMVVHAATADQEPVEGPIGLHEAMARALKYNLDHRVAMIETSLATNDFELSRYDMLPQLVANTGYFGRDNEPGASSISLLSGRQSLEPSRSTEQYYFGSDITMSWNVLDFGLSYIRSKQLGDEALIAEERRRKAINEIMQDVRSAYWRAASAERLSQELATIKIDVEKAYDDSKLQFAARRTEPLSALTYQRELTEIRAEAQALELELISAKRRLARLMNLPAGQEFEVILPDRSDAPANIDISLADAVELALDNRPEVREAAYRVRISDQEFTKALVEALPSVDLYSGFHNDSNDLLFNEDYLQFGAKASWNLLKVFQTPHRRQRAKVQGELERQRAYATAVAVSSQVHLGMVRYSKLLEALDTAQEAHEVQTNILSQIRLGAEVGRVSRQTLVRERMNQIVAEARYDIAYADTQEAFAQLYAAMGYDPFSAHTETDENVKTVAQTLSELWGSRAGQPPE